MMRTSIALGTALLVSTALTHPALAQGAAQSAPATSAPVMDTPVDAQPASPDSPTDQTAIPGTDGGAAVDGAAEEDVDISIPGGSGSYGGDIVVTGRNIPNVVKATPQVVSVLSSADIARTGEGDIAGALQRVTGLSIVGEGFVYVRGLGDRYSLSLLNGSPLPSPDPLKRVVPLDIFPSSLIASGLVQKSYSPNFPGEYGGGVINLTTSAIPREPFIQIGGSIGYDSITTRKLGYTYYGSSSDWLGYDNGARDMPDFLVDESGQPNTGITPAQTATLTNADTTLLQRNFDIPPAFGLDFSAGTSFDVGSDALFGIIASAGYSNSWQTRDARRQLAGDASGEVQSDFADVSTDNRVLVNGLFGLGLEVGDHKFRLTNLYIHDTVKQGRLTSGVNQFSGVDDNVIEQQTSFVERQLYDLQGAAELRFGDLSLDLRGTYANTKRKSPYERSFRYTLLVRDNATPAAGYENPVGGGSDATITFSELNEDLYAAGFDVGYDLPTPRPAKVTAGYAYSDAERQSSRYFFSYTGGADVGFSRLRPDILLSRDVILNQGLRLEPGGGASAAAYAAKLEVHGAYAMAEAELLDGLRVSGGVRYEEATESVTPLGAFTSTTLANDYWLPALTVTWNFRENMQFRAHVSKTIARPQFRELALQQFQDFSSNRTYVGNPLLQDSQLYNAEARFEWFFARDQRLSVAAFYKRIEDPIEVVSSLDISDGSFLQGFGNAPEASLYGVELELQKYFPLADMVQGAFFETKRLVAVANYTYSHSELKVGAELIADPFPSLEPAPAAKFFTDGAPLTGQSDHLVNLQLGIEDTESLSQLTFLLNYASERVTTRGPTNQPDFIERPGMTFDIVFRQGFDLFGRELEIKAEARNLLSTNYEETQTFANGTVVNINTYDKGPTFSFGASLKF